MLKKEIRVVGIDDGPFDKFKDKKCLIVATVFRGGDFIDGVLSTKCKVDGEDSTKKIASMINKCKFKPQLRAVFLKGIAVGGFNVIDIIKLSRLTKLPIIVVIRNFPDYKKIFSALEKIKQKNKIKTIKSFPEPIKYGKIYVQNINISLDKTRDLLNLTCTHAEIPEPLRVAHLIAQGIVSGESKGRA